MRPVSRGSVNKSRSVRQFRKNSSRTKRANVNTSPMRGEHCFTWQPHGSQFTIIEDVPDKGLVIRIKQPPILDKEKTTVS